MDSKLLTGRTKITSNVTKVNRDNVLQVLANAIGMHEKNASEEKYLWEYYKGNQPVLQRIKEIRPEICSRVVENRAAEIVQWKTGYLLSSPITYVSTNPDDSVSEDMSTLNSFMRAEGKVAKDKTLVEYMHVMGLGYRMILPDIAQDEDDSPFEIFVPDPQRVFVVYSSGIDERPLMGVYYTFDENNDKIYSIYTPEEYFEVKNGFEIIRNEPHALGMIPIFEYDMGNTRMGAFEYVIPILDAINELDSDRVDGARQTIEQLCIAYNCNFEEGVTANTIREAGMIQLKSVGENKADFKILESTLNQTDTQTFKEDLHSAYLTICGMPNRNGGSSTSDNGIAVIYRDGFTDAESRAQNTEDDIKRVEQEMLKLVLHICNETGNIGNLNIRDIECKFTRRLYDNMQTKAQVLNMMLGNEKIAPQLAFQVCGLFSSPDDAFRASMEWYEKNKTEAINANTDGDTEKTVQVGRGQPNGAGDNDLQEDEGTGEA